MFAAFVVAKNHMFAAFAVANLYTIMDITFERHLHLY